jgi:hypothetical protein
VVGVALLPGSFSRRLFRVAAAEDLDKVFVVHMADWKDIYAPTRDDTTN